MGISKIIWVFAHCMLFSCFFLKVVKHFESAKVFYKFPIITILFAEQDTKHINCHCQNLYASYAWTCVTQKEELYITVHDVYNYQVLHKRHYSTGSISL